MHDDDIDDTVIRPSRVRPPQDRAADASDDTIIRPAPAGKREPSSDDTVIRQPRLPSDDPFGDTVIRPGAVPGSAGVDGPVAAPGTRSADGTDRRGAPREPQEDLSEDTVVRPPARPADRGAPAGGAEPGLPSDRTTRVPSIRVGDRVIRLDRPVVVGRRPAASRFERGTAPALVTVPSPRGEVSSSHVRLHAEGEATVVEDLRSTNGTVVRPAGAAPFRMAAGGANVVLTGTLVEIGDGNVIEVLSPHLRVASTAGELPPFPAWPTDPPAHGTPRTPRERS